MLEIKKNTFAEISVLPEFKILTDEYGDEGQIEGIPKGKVDYDMYRKYEQVGMLTIFAAFVDQKLIGFIFLLAVVLPHRTVKMTVEEAIFVSKQYRRTGAGAKLIDLAEKFAKENGSFGNLFTVPADGILDKVLEHKKYKKIQHVRLKVCE